MAWGSYKLRALSNTGALAAVFIGFLTFGIGGPIPGILLILFFVSSSALSRVGKQAKGRLANMFDKGGQRDHGQVMANGAIAAVLAAAYGLGGDALWLAAASGALASANADTWATEIGVLSRTWPRSITNGARVGPGTSGAISLVGSLAAAGGAGCIGVAAWWLTGNWAYLVVCLAGGLSGALVDSLLGATVQGIYYCDVCQKETERHPKHSCGSNTVRIRGWDWLRNDGVNLAATAVGALVGTGAAILII
jgi:uncharacterized protein (TIGR00297 family)